MHTKKLSILATLLAAATAAAHSPMAWSEIERIYDRPLPPPPPPGQGIPSSIETIYVVEMSHLDIGFTAPPSEVAETHWRILENVVSFADQDSDFRWTVEELWQLEQFWIRADAGSRLRMRELIEAGRVEVGGGLASMHSASMAPWEMIRWMGAAGLAGRALGIAPRVVLGDDVPGWSWGLPEVMADAGIRYFLAGANDFIGTGATIPRADYPFRWSGPGGDEVLTWIADGSYAEGYIEYGLLTVQTAFQQLSRRLPEWEEAGYPFDAILVMRGFDNADASLGMADLAREWNATYDNPKLRLATPSEFFEHILETAPDLTGYRGDWAGRWDVVAIIAPRTQIKNRRSQLRAPAAEALSVAGEWLAESPGTARDRRRWRRIAHDIAEYDEHSGGGAPWPGLLTVEETELHNREVAEVARRADRWTREELDEALAALAQGVTSGDSLAVVVANAREWERGGVVGVELPEGWPPGAVEVVDDATGSVLPVQPVPGAERILVEVPPVPPVGYRRLLVRRSAPAPAICSERGRSRPGIELGDEATVLDNGVLRVRVEHGDGRISSLVDLRSGREWIDSALDQPFNGMIRASNRQHLIGLVHPTQAGAVEPLIQADGPLLQAVRFRRAGSAHRFVDVALRRASSVLELSNTVLRDALPHVPYSRSFDYFAFRFPLDLDPFAARIASPAGPMRLYGEQPDQLPGAEMGRFSVGPWVDLSGAQASITMLTPDALVAEFETIQFSRQEAPQRATLVSRFDKKADEAQYFGGAIGPVDVEPGEGSRMVLRYGLVPREGGWDALGVSRASAGFADPLRAVVVPPGMGWGTGAAPTASALRLEGAAVEMIDLKPAEDGRGVILRLREIAGSSATVRVMLGNEAVGCALRTDVLERDGAALPVVDGTVEVPVGARATAGVRLLDPDVGT